MARESWREVWRPWYPLVAGTFYFCQGFYTTGFVMYVTVFAVEVFKLSFGTIALLNATVVVPVFLKMIPLAFCDRYPVGKYGRRRPYMLISAVVYALCFAVLSQIMVFNPLWLAMVVISMIAWVVADGNFDGLTIDATPLGKAGVMQGVAWGSRGLGAALGGVIFAFMVTGIDWPFIVLITGLFAILQCLSGMIIKEPKVTKERLASGRDFKRAFGKRETQVGLVYIFLASAGLAVSETLAASYFKTQGQISDTQLGITLAIVNSGIFVGSLVFGFVSDKTGTRRALIFGNVLGVTACLLLASVMPEQVLWLMVSAFLIGVFQGAQMTSLLRMYMELSPAAIGGTMFATCTSIGNAGMALLGSLTISIVSSMVGAAYSMLSVIPYVLLASLIIPLMKLYNSKEANPR
jgi:MFS family permease